MERAKREPADVGADGLVAGGGAGLARPLVPFDAEVADAVLTEQSFAPAAGSGETIKDEAAVRGPAQEQRRAVGADDDLVAVGGGVEAVGGVEEGLGAAGAVLHEPQDESVGGVDRVFGVAAVGHFPAELAQGLREAVERERAGVDPVAHVGLPALFFAGDEHEVLPERFAGFGGEVGGRSDEPGVELGRVVARVGDERPEHAEVRTERGRAGAVPGCHLEPVEDAGSPVGCDDLTVEHGSHGHTQSVRDRVTFGKPSVNDSRPS